MTRRMILLAAALAASASCSEAEVAADAAGGVTDTVQPTDGDDEDDEDDDIHYEPESFQVPPGPLTYENVIQPIFQGWCARCHENDTPGKCVGMTCFVSFYEDVTKPAMDFGCQGQTVAECGLGRIRNTKIGKEPILINSGTGEPIIVPDEIEQLIADWIAAGMPER